MASGEAPSGTATSSGTGGGPASEPGGPVFLSFGTSSTTLHPGDTVTFSAVLTDPDGVDDLIGGTLQDELGAVYGTFATSAQEGAYSLAVSWAEIESHQTIAFETGGSAAAVFVAEFFDVAGHHASMTTEITLSCAAGWAYCDGACTDTDTDLDHCGGCGQTCVQQCALGHCVSNCFETLGEVQSCDEFCQEGSSGAASCSTTACGGIAGVAFQDECSTAVATIDDCSTDVPAIFGTTQMSCCCI